MRRNRRGFTLIELMVVISIISLLSSIVLASVKTARMKARDARRKEDLHNIYTALHLYYDENGYLPHTSHTSSNGDSDVGTWDYSSQEGAPDIFLKFLKDPKYFSDGAPVDPINNGSGDVFYDKTGYAYAYHCYSPLQSTKPNTLALGARMDSSGLVYWKAENEPGWKCKMP